MRVINEKSLFVVWAEGAEGGVVECEHFDRGRNHIKRMALALLRKLWLMLKLLKLLMLLL